MRNEQSFGQMFGLVLVVLILAGCGGAQTEPTATLVPPTATPIPPTYTPVPPTYTPIPPTDTPIPPTDTPIPLTDTPIPPTLDTALVTGDQILIEHHNLFPEGIEYDADGKRFLLGSFTQGIVYEVADDGTLHPFIEDETSLMALGLEIDRINNRLLVAKTSPSEEQGMLGAYDLQTGQRIFMTNLTNLYPSDRHMANDVAVDMDGIAYVTDSYAPVIYRVDMQGKASIFIEDRTLFYINGIVAHQDGYLILGANPNLLFKIPIGEPELIQIELPDDVDFQITDGMILHPDGSLIIVTFPKSNIYRLSSDDGWATANRVAMSSGHTLGWATTVALRGEAVYAVYSHLNRWMNKLGDQDTFEIVQVRFEGD
jgi:sugar lactone lactonase YvrE